MITPLELTSECQGEFLHHGWKLVLGYSTQKRRLLLQSARSVSLSKGAIPSHLLPRDLQKDEKHRKRSSLKVQNTLSNFQVRGG